MDQVRQQQQLGKKEGGEDVKNHETYAAVFRLPLFYDLFKAAVPLPGSSYIYI